MEPDVLVMDEPSSNLDTASILDLRKILAFWKSQGKTIIVSEHRLYYLRGLADRFIYLADGQVSHDYSAAEFEQLTEQQRSDMGLRTFALGVSCLRFYRSRKRPPLRFVISTLPIKTNRKPYISWIVKSLRTGSLELSGITAPGNPLFTLFLRLGEALWGDCLERKEIPSERPAEYLLYGHAGGKSSAFHRVGP